LSSNVEEFRVDVDRKRPAREKYHRTKQTTQPEGQCAIHCRSRVLSADSHVTPTPSTCQPTAIDGVGRGPDLGGGIAGLLTRGELRRARVASFQIIEKGADFGGTWYWNGYPA